MKVLIFGATGMVGQGALRECLRDSGVELVATVGRTPSQSRNPAVPHIIRSVTILRSLWLYVRRRREEFRHVLSILILQNNPAWIPVKTMSPSLFLMSDTTGGAAI